MIQQGLVRMSYIGRLYAICGIMDTMVGILRGIAILSCPWWSPAVTLCCACCGSGSCSLTRFREPVYPYPITWAITGAFHIIMFWRSKGVQGTGERSSYLSVDGHHPEATGSEKKSGWGLCAEISAASA